MPPRNRATVHVDEHYRQWGDSAERKILEALAEVSPAMAEAAKTAEVRRLSGELADSIHALPPTKTDKGYEGGIGASDFKAVWYELGTLGRRSKAAKGARTTTRGIGREKRRKAEKGQTGVKALHYLRKGLYAGRAAAFARIGAALRDAQSGLG